MGRKTVCVCVGGGGLKKGLLFDEVNSRWV